MIPKHFLIYPRIAVLLAGLMGAAALRADPLTKQQEIDFGREVASRNLKGLATRSDGRILPGPVFTDLTGPKLGEILWTLQPVSPGRFLVGTGPDGKVQEVTFNARDHTYSTREVADVTETQAIAVQPLPDGGLLVGTSPVAAVYVFKNGQAVARVPLPADSVFDFLPLPDGTILAGTGNPGKIYRLDVTKLAAAGVLTGNPEEGSLAAHGITLFGEIRDRNVRRLARLADGRIIAGSSPKGNLYAFDASALRASPVILQENRDSEVVDLLPLPDGGFYAAVVATPGDVLRIAKPAEPAKDGAKDSKDDGLKESPTRPAFQGRSSVQWFPADGFPETVFSKNNIALYRLAQRRDWLLLTAGEQGDAFGYDPVSRRSLVFPGSASAQLNGIAPLGEDRFLLLRNNAPGLALMTFSADGPHELETKKIDLGLPSQLGALRFSRLRGLAPQDVRIEVSTSFGSDELEGWTPWTSLKPVAGGYAADGLRGRHVRYRVKVVGGSPDFQLDKAALYSQPQNRRPTLGDFRIFSPNLALLPSPEPPATVSATLGQLLFPPRDGKDDSNDKRKGALMSSQVVPQTGAQIVYWSVNDPDGDTLAYTFAIRRDDSSEWTDLAIDTPESYVQFDTSSLPEGIYLTRLTTSEQAPRPAGQRLVYTFETDNLVIDRTPPVITTTDVSRVEGKLRLSVSGRDSMSMLAGVEFNLNNGVHDDTMHPADGISDGQQETFFVEIPEARAVGATSVEILLYDQAGNNSAVRLPLK